MQSKLGSFVESLANIAVGYTINLIAQMVIFPLFGVHVTVSKCAGIGLAFTAISIVRSYCIRRWFNRL